jgi:phosphohistidine phosphatase
LWQAPFNSSTGTRERPYRRHEGTAVRTLLILRHAKSSWDDSTLSDHQRPLNARGERDAPRMGALARDERLFPDLIISSDAVRARLTAEAMAQALGYRRQLLLDARLYHANPADILDVVRSAVADDVSTVMIVGHNPGLEELVAQLTGEPEHLPTGALARIDLAIDSWSDLDATTRGTLAGSWSPDSTSGS